MSDNIENTGNIHVTGSVSTETAQETPAHVSILAEIETELALIPHEIIARVEALVHKLREAL